MVRVSGGEGCKRANEAADENTGGAAPMRLVLVKLSRVFYGASAGVPIDDAHDWTHLGEDASSPVPCATGSDQCNPSDFFSGVYTAECDVRGHTGRASATRPYSIPCSRRAVGL